MSVALRIRFIVATVIGLFILLFLDFGHACHDATACPHNPPVLILGVSLSLSGKFAAVGDSMRRSYELWGKEVNDRGGIKGIKVVLKFADDKSNRDLAPAAVQELITAQKAEVIFGPSFAAAIPTVLSLAEKLEYPLIVPSLATAKSFRKARYGVMLLSPVDEYLRGAVETAKALGLRRVALVGEVGSPELLVSGYVKKRELNLIAKLQFKKGLDFAAISSDLKGKKAEAIFFVNSTVDQGVSFTKEIKQMIPAAKMLVVTSGADTDQYRKFLGNLADRVYMPAVWHQRLRTPRNKKFAANYLAMYKKPADQNAAIAYAMGTILEKALTEVYSPQRGIFFHDALRQLKTSTIIGGYAIAKGGVQKGHSPLLIQWQQGKQQVVWPPKYATKEPKK